MRAVLSIAIVSLFFVSGCFTPIIDFGFLGRVSPLSEVTISGDAQAKLVMLEVSGVISFKQEGWSFGGQQPSLISRLHEALSLAAADPDVKGLILRIRSPGGGVAASETLYHLVSDWKRETHKPVVAFFQGVAASGGYYVATAADVIWALPTSVTGSIGVIVSGLNVADLMARHGVVDTSVASGGNKQLLSPTRPIVPEHAAILQGIV
ncbi:MAG: S49 family peptidase, partial [Candidatus Hydrogenedentes bacterium]|nr:S49 family peptidase [Candidatus Hydrogenedentota bacterium]